MSGNSPVGRELRILMDQALQTSVALQNYTNENFDSFFGEDDEKINELINSREKMIETLIGIEYRIDSILNEAKEYDFGTSLPADIDDIRRSVRKTLDEVSARDMEIMKLIAGKMQKYKTETLKARNKKNLSAYMRTAFSDETGDSVDFKK
ncbi:MAG: hypothetical protein GXY05_02740 [Clostridiales bacterium]|nr:hypothetical protein [Clostridiales bacterium]